MLRKVKRARNKNNKKRIKKMLRNQKRKLKGRRILMLQRSLYLLSSAFKRNAAHKSWPMRIKMGNIKIKK